jgi:hypothetical protein
LSAVLASLPASSNVVAADLVTFSMAGRSDLQDVLAYAVVTEGPLDISIMPHKYPGRAAGASTPTPQEIFFTIYSATSGGAIASQVVNP